MGDDWKVHMIQHNAAISQAHMSTFRLMDLTDPKGGGSAVAVTIGSRYFLATAGHVLQKSHQFELILRDSVCGSITTFIALHQSDIGDVGLLELDPVHAKQAGDVFVPLSRLGSTFDNSREHDVCVLGFPGESMHPIHHGQMKSDQAIELWDVNAFTYCSSTIPMTGWPSRVGDRTPERRVDVFVYFNPEDRLYDAHPARAGDRLPKIAGSRPDPSGMSGGGIWHFGEAKSDVWQPDATLVGIQFAVDTDRKKWMHGALISVWLELVKKHYPDLRHTISNQSIRPGGSGVSPVPRAPERAPNVNRTEETL